MRNFIKEELMVARVWHPVKWIFFGFICLVLMNTAILSVRAAGVDVSDSSPASAHSSQALQGINSLGLADVFGVNAIYAAQSTGGGSTVSAAGARWLHMGIDWANLAATSAVTPTLYSWGPYDAWLSLAAGQGYSIIAALGENPSWAASFDRGVINCVDPNTRYVEYVTAVVQRYSVAPYNVHYWEVYNEPDAKSFTLANNSCAGNKNALAFGDHPQAYYDTLKLAHDAIKAADPNATVVLGGIAYEGSIGIFDTTFLSNILTLGAANYFDVVNFHYYPAFDASWQALEPGQFGIAAKATAVKSILASHNVFKPLICTELGSSSNSTSVPGATLDSQARDVVKHYSRSIATGIKIGIWYNLADYPAAPGDYFAFNGLLDTNYAAKPSLNAYQVMSTYLNGGSYNHALNANDYGGSLLEGYDFLNVPNSEEIIIVWTQDSSTKTIVLPSGVTAVKDKFNSNVSHTTNLSVTGDPVYIFRHVTFTISDYFLPLIKK